MKILEEIKFKNKLLLIIIMPLIGLIYFSFSGILGKLSTYNEMNRLEGLTNLSSKISTLVHETQKERGRTAGFLGSEGKKFVSEISDQRSNTDQKINELNKFLVTFNKNNPDVQLSSLISDAMSRLNNIKIKKEWNLSIKYQGRCCYQILY